MTYIINSYRTAIGSFNGLLAGVSAVDLAIPLVKKLVEEAHIDLEIVDECIVGNVLSAGLGQNIARQIAIKSGISNAKTGLTINMVCGSGLRALTLASQAIQTGDADIVIAGGTENMSQSPYVLPKARSGYRMGHGQIIDIMIQDGLWDVFNNIHMGITAENLAEKYSISREEQDIFACASQNKAEHAIKAGKFKDEIVPIIVPQRKKDDIVVEIDEYPRAGATVESLAKLKPAFKQDGTVTAGNSSGVNDGAALLLLASEQAIKKYNLHPKAVLKSYGYSGTDPAIMGIGPVGAIKTALAKAGWSIEDLDLIESNEAFASQALSVEKELQWNSDIVNVNGGAIALGHPIGASGARIVTTLVHEMHKRNSKKALAALCIGGGMGIAACIEGV